MRKALQTFLRDPLRTSMQRQESFLLVVFRILFAIFIAVQSLRCHPRPNSKSQLKLKQLQRVPADPVFEEMTPPQETEDNTLEMEGGQPASNDRPDDLQTEDNVDSLTEKEDSQPEFEFAVGASCDVQSDCGDLNASCLLESDRLNATLIDGGYCTFRECDIGNVCPSNTVCHQPSNMSTSICVNSCASANDCRSGFSCIDNLCWIETPQPIIDPNRPVLEGTITFDHYSISPRGDGYTFELTGQRAATGLLAIVRDSQGTTITQNWVDENGRYQLQLRTCLGR